MHPNPRRIVPVIFIIVLVIAAWWYFSQRSMTTQNGGLSASGTIEAAQVVVAPELGGQVAEVYVQEGDAVQAGQPLVRFGDRLLQAQYNQAKATLALAQANYDLVAAGVPAEQRQVASAAAELERLNAQQSLEDLEENASVAAAQAQLAVAAADKSLDLARQHLDSIQEEADQADIDAAEAAVTMAKDKLDKAREDFKPYEKKPEDNLTRAMFQAKLADAQKKYDATVTRLNNLSGTANEFDLALAQANQALALEQLEAARRAYTDLKDGPDPVALNLARARLALAEANLEAARAEPTAEQLAVAQRQVESAQAALEVVQAQVDKLVILSPSAGLVLARSVEPGEVIFTGAQLITLARMGDLTITVYVPEDRYGAITLGQQAVLTADSFPGEAFTAIVVDIADQAEFTPRNVQTAEGRSTTVYAIKLAIDDPTGKLKPGMPADVSFIS